MNASNGPRSYGISGRILQKAPADAGYLPTVNAIYGKNHGFPEESAAISDLLRHPEGLQNLRDELEQFVQAYRENRELLRFHFHRPQKLLEQLSDLQREPLHFTAAEGYAPSGVFSSPGTRSTTFSGVENAAPITGWPCILSIATTQSARNGRIS